MIFNNIYKDKTVLVTGHTGFKGSWLSLWLTQLGANVIGYSVNIPTLPSHFQAAKLETKLIHQLGDVTETDKLKKLINKHKPHIVFHLAAQALVAEAYQHPQQTFKTNLMGTVSMLDALLQTECVEAAVIITSDKCYENVEWEYGYREIDRLGGHDPYSASKACAEIAFSAYYRSFFKNKKTLLATTRAGNVIGGGDWAANRIVPDYIRSYAAKQSLILRAPFATRPWQHVLEPLSGYLLLGQQLLTKNHALSGEAFNFGPSAHASHTVETLVKALQQFLHGKYHIDCDAMPIKEAGLLKLDCSRALHQLNWSPTLSFQETVELTAKWYQHYYHPTLSIEEFSLQQINHYVNHASQREAIWTQQ